MYNAFVLPRTRFLPHMAVSASHPLRVASHACRCPSGICPAFRRRQSWQALLPARLSAQIGTFFANFIVRHRSAEPRLSCLLDAASICSPQATISPVLTVSALPAWQDTLTAFVSSRHRQDCRMYCLSETQVEGKTKRALTVVSGIHLYARTPASRCPRRLRVVQIVVKSVSAPDKVL
jgi:hypothetical protein